MTWLGRASKKELQLEILDIICRQTRINWSDLAPLIFRNPHTMSTDEQETRRCDILRQVLRDLHSKDHIHVMRHDVPMAPDEVHWGDPDGETVELNHKGRYLVVHREPPLRSTGNQRGRNSICVDPQPRSIPEIIAEIERSSRRPRNEEWTNDGIARAIDRRRGQAKFRSDLLGAYGRQCVITGPCPDEILEAAHIRPYSEGGDFKVSNGLLLRADIHTLFDLWLVAIDPRSMTVVISPRLHGTSYAALSGQVLHPPHDPKDSPDTLALTKRLQSMASFTA